MRKQQTLAGIAVVEGFGFWTGRDVRLEFRPAPVNSGIRFVRTDLPSKPVIPALVQYRIDKPRQTSLACAGVQVDMVEHVLAAVRGAGIDNCDILTDAPEMPGLDGSGAPFFNALKRAGIETQSRNMPCRVIADDTRFEFENGYLDVRVSSCDDTRFGYALRYDESEGRHPIGSQEYSCRFCSETFEKEVVSSRTFLLEPEARFLVSKGLCGRVTWRDVLVFGDNGPIENTLRYENECARHKTLDMIGDFALVPELWLGEFFACRTGHKQNAEAVLRLLDHTSVVS